MIDSLSHVLLKNVRWSGNRWHVQRLVFHIGRLFLDFHDSAFADSVRVGEPDSVEFSRTVQSEVDFRREASGTDQQQSSQQVGDRSSQVGVEAQLRFPLAASRSFRPGLCGWRSLVQR